MQRAMSPGPLDDAGWVGEMETIAFVLQIMLCHGALPNRLSSSSSAGWEAKIQKFPYPIADVQVIGPGVRSSSQSPQALLNLTHATKGQGTGMPVSDTRAKSEW